MENQNTGKKLKTLTKFFLILSSIFVLIIFGIWINYDKIVWNEAVKIMNKVFGINIEEWDFDYEYENTLELFQLGGYIRVKVTTTPEQLEKILDDYKGTWMKNDKETFEDGCEDVNSLDITNRQMLARELDIPLEELNGRTIISGHTMRRKTPFANTVTSDLSDYVHVQSNIDGSVTILFYYCE